MFAKVPQCSVLALVLVLGAACSGDTSTLPARSVSAGGKMEPSPVTPNTVRYIKPGTDFKRYTQFMIEPATIYSGSDAQYDNTTAEERREVATFISSEFRRVIGQRYQVVTAPGPNVMRVNLQLAGIEKTSTGMAAVTHILPIGLVVNAAKAGNEGAQGSFMGSVTLSAVLQDSQSNSELATFITKQSANAMDVGAMGGALDASKAGVTEAADRLLQAIDKVQGRTPPPK